MNMLLSSDLSGGKAADIKYIIAVVITTLKQKYREQKTHSGLQWGEKDVKQGHFNGDLKKDWPRKEEKKGSFPGRGIGLWQECCIWGKSSWSTGWESGRSKERKWSLVRYKKFGPWPTTKEKPLRSNLEDAFGPLFPSPAGLLSTVRGSVLSLWSCSDTPEWPDPSLSCYDTLLVLYCIVPKALPPSTYRIFLAVFKQNQM